MGCWKWWIVLSFVACRGRSGVGVPVDDAAPMGAAVPMTAAPAACAHPGPLPPVAYDLSADLEARKGAVQKEFGAQTALSIERDVFLFASADHGSQFDVTVRRAHEVLAVYLGGLFARHPDRAVTVLVFSTTDAFQKAFKQHFGRPAGKALGGYSPKSREVLVNAAPGGFTVAHELVHPFMQSDFALAPKWLDEGLASLFEAAVLEPPGEIHGATNWRYWILRDALSRPAQRAKAGLADLFRLSDEDFDGKGVDLHYAMARFFCQWLDERGLLWAFYREWRGSVAVDPRGEAAFGKVVGEKPEQATEEWLRWFEKLRPPPR